MTELARLEVEEHRGIVVLRLLGEIDLSNAEDIEAALISAAAGQASVVIDLSDLTYIDSAGLAMLQRVSQRLEPSGCRLCVVAREGSLVRRVLDSSRMDAVFSMFEDLAEAVASCAAAQVDV